MGTLTIHFRGACTHFRNVVPGVPHRVVLVDGTAARFGIVAVHGGAYEKYILFPHAPFLFDDQPQRGRRGVNVRGCIDEGHIYSGVQLDVANASRAPLRYDDNFTRIPPIAEYADDYEVSPDVVMDGNAACYFDFSSGDVRSETIGEALHGVVTVQTDGDPVVRVTPLAERRRGGRAHELRVASGTNLFVENGDMARPEPYAPFDFLLHFLTAKRGIPRMLTRQPYGRRRSSLHGKIHPSVYGSHLTALLETGWPAPRALDVDAFPAMPAGSFAPALDHGASCSDSRYP